MPSFKLPRLQIFQAAFFLGWAINCIFSHWVGHQLLQQAQAYRVAEQEGNAEPYELDGHQRGKGVALMLANFPLFVGLGLIIHSADPTPGVGYWALLLGGATYAPFFAALCLFFLMHPPSEPGKFPGEEWDDGTTKDDFDDDDQ